MLIASPAPAQIVAEMVALVRPGGWVALVDAHSATGLCYPPHPAYDRLVELQNAVYLHRGQDPFIGPRLPVLLRAAGLVDVQVHAHTVVFPGAERYAQLAAIIAGIPAEAITNGFTTDAEVSELLEALGTHMRAPDALGVRPLFFTAWGRKPAA